MAGPKIEFPKRKAPKKKTTQKGGTKKGATKKDTKGDPKKPDEQTLPEESNTILADVSNKDELVKILDSMDTNQARNAILGLDNEPFYVIQDPKTNNLHFKESYSLIVELLKEKNTGKASLLNQFFLGVFLGCFIILVMFIQIIGHIFEPDVSTLI